MVVLGLVVFVLIAVAKAANPDGTFGGGAIVLGVLAVGLIVGGLVIRP